MSANPQMSRRSRILTALLLGVLCFGIALFSLGGGHGTLLVASLLYPLQFLIVLLLASILEPLRSATASFTLLAILSLPWIPFLTYLLTAPERRVRKLGLLLLLVHGLAAAGLLLFG